MSSKHRLPHSILRSALAVADNQPPLSSVKDPTIGAIAAFALGGVGLYIYTRDTRDFYIPFLMLLFIIILAIPTGGLPLLFIPFFWAYYARRRIIASNQKLERAGGEEILEAEIVTSNPPAIQIPLRTQTTAELRLRQIDDLFQKGLLTPAERDETRQQLLGEL